MNAPMPEPVVSIFRWAAVRLTWLGLLALLYVVLAGLVYLFDHWGRTLGWLRFGGLVLDIVLVAILFRMLARRGNPLAAALGPVLALLAVFLLFALAEPLWARFRFELADAAVHRGWEKNALPSWLQSGIRVDLLTLANFEPYFWSLDNVRTIFAQTTVTAVAALGMTLIIIAGGIDLSAGTALALCAVVLALCMEAGMGISIAIAASLATGCLTGFLNGTLVSLLRVVPFVVTLGTMTIYQGIAKLVANETTVRPPIDATPAWLPPMTRPLPELPWIVWPLLPNFAWGVWLMLLLAWLLAVVLKGTVFGRHVFAIGSSEDTARLCGISVGQTKVLVYTLAGLFVGMAAVYQFSRLSIGNPTGGLGLELKVIAAVVIGGGSLSGGRGSVVGTLTGAAITGVITSGCSALQLSNPIQDIIIGVIIIAAVTLDQWRARRMAV